MPRTKDYSEQVVLEKAMIAFWAGGLKGVTTRELAKVMGINQYSVYASFENKQELFVKALEYYYNKFLLQGMGRPLLGEDLGIKDLEIFLKQFSVAQKKEYPRGCFICNTMIDETDGDQRVQKIIDQYRTFILSAFRKIVKTHHPEENKEYIEKKSQILYGALLGLIIQNRQGIHGKTTKNYIEEMINIIR